MQLKNWKPIIITSLVFISTAIVAIILFSTKPSVQELHPVELSASCGKSGTKFTATLKASLMINHEILGHKPSKLEQEAAISEQLNFLRGIFFNHYNTRSQNIGFNGSWKNLNILKNEVVQYGISQEIDTPNPYPEVPIKEYINKARQREFTKSTDPATRVSYEVDLESVGCSTGSDFATLSFSPLLPIDPFLAYWSVPAKSRIRKIWRSSNAEVSPCIDNEFADLPSPEYFWYFYNPHAPGCESVSNPVAFEKMDLKLTAGNPLPSIVQIDSEELAKVHELHISLVFGYVVHDEQYVKTDLVAKALQEGLSTVDPQLLKWDTSSRQFLWMWNHLSELVDISSTSVLPDVNFLIATIHGKIKNDGKPVVIRAYLGPTDLYGPIPAQHWNETLRGMLHDDVFIYAGHSGLGENLRISRLAELNLPFGELNRRPDYQILAFISCYSYTYFDQGLLPASPFGPSRKKADLFLTGGITYEFGQVGFATLKSILEASGTDGKLDLGKYFPMGTFIVHRSFNSLLPDRVSMR